MSVINQLLLDLEKRRASGAERSTLPSHVRALPDEQRPVPWGLIAAGSATVAAVLAGAWLLVSGAGGTSESAAAAQPRPVVADVAIERVVAASAGVVTAVQAMEPAPREAPASRLSFELSNPPPAVEPVESARVPLPTARVLSRAPAQAPATREPARVEPAPAAPAVAAVKTTAAKPDIRKEVRQPTSRELAELEFRKASSLLHQSRLAEAQEGYQAALASFPAHHGARQGLVGLLIEGRNYAEAERVLQEGLALSPAQLGFAMTLARLQVDRGDNVQATATLKKGLEHGQGGADYLAFLGALLQRQGRHDEAIEQFRAALRIRPGTGVWWLGLAISLQAANRVSEAQEAYGRARSSNGLSPELAAFAEQRLKQLQ